jgi:cell wall-associated NlpC family hydrolase
MSKPPLSRIVLLLFTAMLAVACTTTTHMERNDTIEPAAVPVRAAGNLGEEIALRALAMVGKPYVYGGADLQGFDCSGLVYYIHDALGMMVPRTAATQQRAAMNVDRTALQPGDLVFFRTTSSKQVSHVGVYVGENRFVHAPSSGKLIELRPLDDSYFGPRLVGMGRLYEGA